MLRRPLGALLLSLFSLSCLAADLTCPGRIGATVPLVRVLGLKPSSWILNPAGTRLFVASKTGEIQALDTATLQPVAFFGTRTEIRPHNLPTALAYYGTERILALSGATLLEIGRGGSDGFGIIEKLPRDAHLVATNAATGRIAVALDNGSVLVYRAVSPTSLSKLDVEHTLSLPRVWPLSWNPTIRDTVDAIAMSPDGKSLAVSFNTGSQGFVYVWNLETGKVRYHLSRSDLRTEEGHLSSMDGYPRCPVLAFPYDDRLFTAWTTYRSFFQNWVEKAFLWEGRTGGLLRNFGHSHFVSEAPFPGNITSLAFAPDTIAIGRSGARGFFPKVSVYGMGRNRLATLVGHRDPVAFVLFSPNGTDFFSMSETGELAKWDAKKILQAKGERFAFLGDFLTDPHTGNFGSTRLVDAGE